MIPRIDPDILASEASSHCHPMPHPAPKPPLVRVPAHLHQAARPGPIEMHEPPSLARRLIQYLNPFRA